MTGCITSLSKRDGLAGDHGRSLTLGRLDRVSLLFLFFLVSLFCNIFSGPPVWNKLVKRPRDEKRETNLVEEVSLVSMKVDGWALARRARC